MTIRFGMRAGFDTERLLYPNAARAGRSLRQLLQVRDRRDSCSSWRSLRSARAAFGRSNRGIRVTPIIQVKRVLCAVGLTVG